MLQPLLRQQIRELESYRRALLRDSRQIETVHQMRVLTRRLSEVLRVFKETASAGLARRWRKKIRRLTRVLGSCRSLDMSCQLLRKQFMTADRTTALFVIKTLQKERVRRGRKAVRNLKDFRIRDLKDDLKKIIPDVSGGGEKIADVLNKAVTKRKKSLRNKMVNNRSTPNVRLHKIRIRLKKLRYSSEILALNQRQPESDLESLKRAQKRLGEWHDTVTLVDHVQMLRKSSGGYSHVTRTAWQGLLNKICRRAVGQKALALKELEKIRKTVL